MKSFYFTRILLLSVLHLAGTELMCQCSSYPVPFEQRVSKSAYIVEGKVTEKQCYIVASTGCVNTINKFRVAAWLKNALTEEYVYVITLGGVYGNRAMQVDPALQLDMDHEYLLMLEQDNDQVDDKSFRAQHPQARQMLTYADAQGSLTNENNYYHDLFYRTPKTEASVFEEIGKLTGQVAKTPSGSLFAPRPVTNTFGGPNTSSVITSFSPGTTNAGTIAVTDQISITGTAFGAAAGTVFFTNADDGGATFTSSGVATDNVSWNATDIVVKPARAAGTGPINVNGAMTSGTNLTISYSHLNINSTFSGFGSSTRQRYYLVNKNGTGGYTYTYNTAFAANAPAKAAFQRALSTWRCATGVNFSSSAGTTAITLAAVDGVNTVSFDATLPVGVLGRATSFFNGSATGGCNLANTIWWADELDIQFFPDPPTAGFPWQYGPAAPGFSNYDFESVAAHEMGHHCGLGHVILPGALMHFGLANGASVRNLSVNDIAGGNAKMSYSTLPLCFTPATVLGPMVAISAGSCLLPAELIAFTGYRKNETSNILQWSTAQEVNNNGFYLQRSTDGMVFNEIAFIKGAVNSNQAISYEFMDIKAGPLAMYYRLRQVDIDGREKISKTIFIDGDNDVTAKVWAGETGDKVFVYVKQGTNNNAVLKILNSQGQQVLMKQIDNASTETAVGHLSKGIYYYQLLFKGKIMSGKLLLGNQ